ncbi:hypothetical protein PAHAL_5G234400 [Panicum hallii]|uniref:Uncharacterized protein n=1 Tax=Panicum hallii TaxID=206008 RepID=A0A2S3HTP0_9POAL|nr:hypothetical protein PAHAL_5G234400 [Panicum hallii]
MTTFTKQVPRGGGGGGGWRGAGRTWSSCLSSPCRDARPRAVTPVDRGHSSSSTNRLRLTLRARAPPPQHPRCSQQRRSIGRLPPGVAASQLIDRSVSAGSACYASAKGIIGAGPAQDRRRHAPRRGRARARGHLFLSSPAAEEGYHADKKPPTASVRPGPAGGDSDACGGYSLRWLGVDVYVRRAWRRPGRVRNVPVHVRLRPAHHAGTVAG